jgi:hypothetical protein
VARAQDFSPERFDEGIRAVIAGDRRTAQRWIPAVNPEEAIRRAEIVSTAHASADPRILAAG